MDEGSIVFNVGEKGARETGKGLVARTSMRSKAVGAGSGGRRGFRSLWLKLPFRFKILHPAHKRVSRVVGLGRSGSFRVALGS